MADPFLMMDAFRYATSGPLMLKLALVWDQLWCAFAIHLTCTNIAELGGKCTNDLFTPADDLISKTSHERRWTRRQASQSAANSYASVGRHDGD